MDNRPPSPIDALVISGKLSSEALSRARRISTDAAEPIEPILTRLGLVSERDLADAFAKSLDLPAADLAASTDPALLPRFSASFLRQFQVLPLAHCAEGLAVAMANPLDEYAANALALAADCKVPRQVATETDIGAALDRLLQPAAPPKEVRDGAAAGTDLERLHDLASDAPVIRLVNQILARAVDTRASDIHIEPAADRLIVRNRIDSVMREVEAPPQHLREAVVSRVKIMARLNIAERRLPQDGRMSASVRGTEIDFRVSTVPTVHGESVVIRVLDRDQVALDFDTLGFDAAALDILRPILAMPNGILLVTGPTGSGKTTTLYAALHALNTPERKIMTIEDPVEYYLDRVIQVQIQPAIGLTFAKSLRAFLRQNPNIVMVGEIRDLETAQVAVQVALTGHMILSTLHTNDAASGITRLLDMGVEDYLIVSTVNAIMAQRLVRTLCRECREPYDPPSGLVAKLGLPPNAPQHFHRQIGCPACGSTGFRGRTTILEILPVTDKVRQMVLARATAGDIGRAAVADGMRTMHAHGMLKAAAGITTLEEVLSVTRAV
ncbi:MAG: ATPase, T2SS/T4P/T4SS family [Rhodospirillales bacterium]